MWTTRGVLKSLLENGSLAAMGFGARLIGGMADLVWPPRCVGCLARLSAGDGRVADRLATESCFCELCASSVMRVESPLCPRCGLPFGGAGPDHLCGACLSRPPVFSAIYCAWIYGGPVAQAIIRLKYGANAAIVRPLGEVLARGLDLPGDCDAVVPVPLHVNRLRSRGFNQSALLAKRVAQIREISYRPHLIERTIDTDVQAGLSRKERESNMKGAFTVPQAAPLNGLSLLLVDDIVTTTATVSEAAATLLDAGARSVYVLAVARAAQI